MLSQEIETRLDPRVARTRRLLQDALLALMAEKSFQSITVQEIAERATVNRVTFYAHYIDKQGLLEQTMRERFREDLQRRLPPGAPYSEANLQRLIQFVCEFLVEVTGHCPPPHSQFEPLMEKQVKAELYEVLLGWLEAMPPHKEFHYLVPELTATINSAALYAAALRWKEERKPERAEDFARQMSPWFQASLGRLGAPRDMGIARPAAASRK